MGLRRSHESIDLVARGNCRLKTYDAPSPATRWRMQCTPRRDTRGELALRSALHRRGLRYRVDRRLWPSVRHKVDIVFRSARVLVYFDGCFWHRCPQHFVPPQHNAGWWQTKIARNVTRDRAFQGRAEADGWLVLRVWEHEDLADAANKVEAAIRARTETNRY
jgi:DNA mismatch endonuclease (patch repair protein)